MPSLFYRIDIDMQNVILIALVVVIVLFIVHQFNPHVFSFMNEGFADAPKAAPAAAKPAEKPKEAAKPAAAPAAPAAKPAEKKEGFEDEGFADLSAYEGPAAMASAEAPAGCYPRDQLTPSELLPKDMASIWAEQNPMGPGSLKGKNFLSAGALIGVNTVGQSMRNANLQIRSEPPNPQVAASIWNQSTISPDISHRPLDIGA